MQLRSIRIQKPGGSKMQVTIPQALEYAVTLYQSGDRDQAQAIYRDVLRYLPSSPQELNALGSACYYFGHHQEALTHYRKALASTPRDASLHCNVGLALTGLGRLEDAVRSFEQAIAIDPQNAESHANLGDVFVDLNRHQDAERECRVAITIAPQFAPALNNLGRALEGLGRTDDAREAYQHALEADPNLAVASYNLGALLHRLGELSAPAALFEKGVAAQQDFAQAHYNHALMLLRQGDFAGGFEEYEWRWRCPEFPSARRDFAEPLWDGSDLGGRTILVHAEQGIGDTIHFARLIRQVAARGGRVLFEVQPELLRLLAGLDGVSELVARGGELPAFDFQSPLLSLPRALGLRVNTIPAQVPYVAAEPELAERWRKVRRAGCRHIGLVWAGSASHANDSNRSIDVAKLAPLAGLENIEWFSLQKGSAAQQAPPAGLRLHDLAPELHDFADTAAAIANLDLVITVDTAVAHLAGALGVPVWVLLPQSPDWRWMLDREDSPWYPTMRLFRQTAPGDWDGVFARVVESLAATEAPAVVIQADSDLARWSDPSQIEGQWDRRSSLAADFIPAGSAVLDLGCGAMAIEGFLPAGCTYFPCDLVRRDERTQLCDLNRDQFPEASGATFATVLGVLEYVHDWQDFLRKLRGLKVPAVLTYCPADLTGGLDRAALGWVNHVDLKALVEALHEAGFSIRTSQRIDEHQVLLRLSPDPPLARLTKRVAVLSYNNIGNFGDRLGFHLLNSILPAGAEVTYSHFSPWDIPDEPFDLAVIGLGNSLFKPILTDELIAFVERVPKAIGIFGTQYRESIDGAKLARLVDRLAIWLARYEEDVLLYGRGRSNVLHLGDWLIGQFPMTRWTLDERLAVGREVLEDLPLDRMTQRIQQYREVVSERVHPLLCALTSAERVAYREQREDGTPTGASGKFRSLLMDVFGRTWPEDVWFDVNRDAVASYRARVLAVMAELPVVMKSLLGE